MTLTRRIVVRSLVILALALGSVSALTYQFVRVSGREDLDRFLRRESDQLIAAFVDAVADNTGVDGLLSVPEATRSARTALAIHPSGPQHVAAITVDGTRVQATGGPPDAAALLRGEAAPARRPGRLRTVDTEIGQLRVLDVAVADPTGTTVAVATLVAPLGPSRDAAVVALTRTLAAAAIALLVAGGLLTVVVRRSLRHLRDLSTSAAAITPDTLTTRVHVPDTGDEVERLATELNEMLQRLDDDDRTRRRYLAAISHEVRTPLTVADGHLQLLMQEQVDPVATASTVRSELDRLRRVLDDLLSVGRGADEIVIRAGPIFLPDLFTAIGARIDALGLSERVRIEAPPPVAFTGDQTRIEQSVANLVANAIDHNPPTTIVAITGAHAGDRVTITVADDGTGIDPTILPHVREPFTTTKQDGPRRASGLGLTVVDSLTAAQHGTLELTTGPTGTAATLTYPTNPPL